MDNDTFKQLTNEYELLNLLHYRSKNQHSQQNWFKYLNIIHRNLRKILKLQIDINRIKNQKKIKYKSEEILKIANYIIKISRTAYWNYNSILVLGQFITLGLAFIGNLSKIYCLLLDIPGVKKSKHYIPTTIEEQNGLNNVTMNQLFEQNGGDDLGEEVNLEELEKIEASNDSTGKNDKINDINVAEETTPPIKPVKESDTDIPSSNTTSPSSSKTSKPTTKKRKAISDSTIDDIFGSNKSTKRKKIVYLTTTNTKNKKKKKPKSLIDDIFKS
ncbi:RMP1 [Candida jiufengensis]|uniref:RMP1 n=1 Tax=Candida jiufengensis TaxID=497108 RepID=UPI0022241492|nr:RMP1 [Candida jiufengensis]KAI5954332.1 RMP1 [Candida jiufengensis]